MSHGSVVDLTLRDLPPFVLVGILPDGNDEEAALGAPVRRTEDVGMDVPTQVCEAQRANETTSGLGVRLPNRGEREDLTPPPLLFRVHDGEAGELLDRCGTQPTVPKIRQKLVELLESSRVARRGHVDRQDRRTVDFDHTGRRFVWEVPGHDVSRGAGIIVAERDHLRKRQSVVHLKPKGVHGPSKTASAGKWEWSPLSLP
jgi:hypothetical protein